MIRALKVVAAVLAGLFVLVLAAGACVCVDVVELSLPLGQEPAGTCSEHTGAGE